jgi:hypothetical protein
VRSSLAARITVYYYGPCVRHGLLLSEWFFVMGRACVTVYYYGLCVRHSLLLSRCCSPCMRHSLLFRPCMRNVLGTPSKFHRIAQPPTAPAAPVIYPLQHHCRACKYDNIFRSYELHMAVPVLAFIFHARCVAGVVTARAYATTFS